MMADLISEADGNDKNFILAKLVSIFGDSVDFDVINIVAQENEWNEVKCIESLTVLGEYKNPPAILPTEEIESVQLCSQTPNTVVNDKRVDASSCSSFERMPQNKRTLHYPATAPPRSSHSVSGAINKKTENVQHRHPSPAPSSSSKSKERSSETQEHHEQVKNLIASGTPVLILLRALKHYRSGQRIIDDVIASNSIILQTLQPKMWVNWSKIFFKPRDMVKLSLFDEVLGHICTLEVNEEEAERVYEDLAFATTLLEWEKVKEGTSSCNTRDEDASQAQVIENQNDVFNEGVGLPGSGKSSLSKQLLALPGGKSGCTCSADDFFLVPQGGKGQKEYLYDPLRLDDAHKHCRVQVLRAIAHGVSPIIVDNTNTQAWEMLPYVEMALEPWKAEENLKQMVSNGTIAKRNLCNSLGPFRNSLKGKKCNCGYTVMEPVIVPYQVELLEPLTWWYRNPSRLAKVNQHGVSQRKITQMLSHFEYGLTGKDLIKQILKKKQLKNHANHSDLKNHPATTKVRPFKEKKPSAHFTGPPLFNTNHGNANARNLPNQFVYGNNQFQQPSANQFRNFMGFPPGPYTPPVLYPPNMFNVGSVSQPGVSKRTDTESADSKKQLHLAPEESHLKKSSSNPPIFPGIEPSTIFSSQEIEQNIDSDESSSENASSKSDVIGPNPFLKSLNSSNQDKSTSSIFQGECIEITEEEEQEWMKANASKYVDWKSSDEEESGDELQKEFYEPKPARSCQGRHVNLEAAKNSGKIPGDSDCQDSEGEEEIAEWITEEGDHLASWDIPSSHSNGVSQTISNDSSESKNEGPLPPRSPKKRSPVENSPKGTDDAEQTEKVPNSTEGHEFDWITDIRLLLKALGLDKDNSDSAKQSSNDTDNTDSMKAATLKSNHRNGNPTSDSKDQGKMGSVLSQVGQEELDSESYMNSKSVITVQLDSSNVKIQGESKSECLPAVDTAVSLVVPIEENLVSEPTVMATDSSITKVGTNDQVIEHVAEGLPETEQIFSDTPDISGNIKSASFIDEFHDSWSERKDCDTKIVQNITEDSVIEGTKDISTEISDLDSLQSDVAREKETQNLIKLNDNDFNNSDNISETNSLHEQVKMSVLTSLLIGIEKAQKRSPEEFESSEKLSESVQTEGSKLETYEFHLEEGKAQSMGSGGTKTEIKLISDGGSDRGGVTVLETSDVGSGPPPIPTTVDGNSKEPESIGKCKEHSAHQNELCDFDIFPSLPGNSSSMERSLCKADDTKDSGGNILPSLVSLSSEESSSVLIIKQNSNSLLELNLSLKENNDDSFTDVTNQDSIMCPRPIYPSAVPHEYEIVSHSLDIQSNQTKIIPDMSLEEENIPKESSELNDQIRNFHEIPCKNPAIPTDQNIFEKAGNYKIKSFGVNSKKSPTSDSTYLELCNEVEATKISKTFSEIEDVVVGKELPTDMRPDSKEEDSMLNCDCDDDNETYPIVLDPNFVELMYRNFGNPYAEPLYESPKCGPTSGVTVNIPSSLARKLHQCLLKSQWDSILAEDEISQKMVIEDELLARQLQELEKEDLKDLRERNPSTTTPNLREIMDMEMAMAMYKADQNKNMQPNQRNDMSTRLTWDLLVKEFPKIPQNIIAQIFSAYDYSYANVREALLTSLPEYERDSHAGAVKDVISPETIAAQEKILLENAKMESLKFQQRGLQVEEEGEETYEEANVVEGSWEEMVEEARKSAALNRRLQKERHAQAQAANRSGMASAAAYYCQMATLHKQKAEEENRKAANILSKVFTGNYGSSLGDKVGTNPQHSPPPTLDMHSMKVMEAVTVMNAFLDTHIEWLRTEKTRQHNDTSRKISHTKTKTLFLVTGRGINSKGGIPRIKPAVERQLEMRGIWYEEMNPGLLRVMVSANQPTKRKV